MDVGWAGSDGDDPGQDAEGRVVGDHSREQEYRI